MKKKLFRPKSGRMVAGVALGLSKYFGINVIFVRFVWVLMILPGGAPGVIPYIILWLLMPSEDKAFKQTE